jgi:hypothetical protein
MIGDDMNTVKMKNQSKSEYEAAELINKNIHEHKHTAFIGSIGIYSGLFLITYDNIVYAKDPGVTWDGLATAKVDHFCDVTITEV